MKERPILFSGAMVRALLAGQKTQTRRVVKRQFAPDADVGEVANTTPEGWLTSGHSGLWWDDAAADIDSAIGCPYGVPGDRLWVRETWTWHGGMVNCQKPHDAGEFHELFVTYHADDSRHTIKPGGFVPTPEQPPQRKGEIYSLRDAPDDFAYNGENTYMDRLSRWWSRKIPAIHMYRWASRITLEITSVRVERLQMIGEVDAMAEGAEPLLVPPDGGSCPHVEGFRALWTSINGPGSWGADPWVWVIDFKRLEG